MRERIVEVIPEAIKICPRVHHYVLKLRGPRLPSAVRG
jgi:hypothetical protein